VKGNGLKNSRRKFLAAAGAAGVATLGTRFPSWAEDTGLAPACTPGEATPKQTAGPYFKPDSPQRSLLIEPGEKAAPLVLGGLVLTRSCKPIAKALLDFWHADETGRYDLKGYRYRGHIFSDQAGRFEIKTILPGPYGGRARHIHVRVQPADGAILTTQLYFPGETANRDDSLFDPALLLKLSRNVSPLAARFDFVLRA
jgi:protocatechuate 3,4-dioxygenase beta subunit